MQGVIVILFSEHEAHKLLNLISDSFSMVREKERKRKWGWKLRVRSSGRFGYFWRYENFQLWGGGGGKPHSKKKKELGHRPNWSYESQPHIMCIRGPTVSSALTRTNGLHVRARKKKVWGSAVLRIGNVFFFWLLKQNFNRHCSKEENINWGKRQKGIWGPTGGGGGRKQYWSL